MKSAKRVPVELLRSDFATDVECQEYYKKLWERFNLLDPKYNFSVSCFDGKVTYHKRNKAHIPIVKMSKSDQ